MNIFGARPSDPALLLSYHVNYFIVNHTETGLAPDLNRVNFGQAGGLKLKYEYVAPFIKT